MKPFLSDEERAQTVRNLVVARYHHQAKITRHDRLVPYLNEGRIKILCDLKKSGRYPIHDTSEFIRDYKQFFEAKDAETYFEWLIATVTGSKENVSEDIVKQADDQLFHFIDVLGGSIHYEKNVQLLAPYDWQALFSSFDKRLAEMRNIIDKGDKDIVEVLKPILEMMKRNTKLLDALQKENEKIFGKGNTP